MSLILALVATAIIGVAFLYELSRDLMMFQQNSYRRERYMHWLRQSGDTTSWWRLIALIILFVSLSSLCKSDYVAYILTSILAISLIAKLSRAHYKKPLAWTARARRIYAVSIVVAAIAVATGSLACDFTGGHMKPVVLTLLGCYCASHIIIIVANTILKPVDFAINRHYYNDAAKRLASMPDLKIIGITGSYGKTSTKHYLHRILSEQFDTLMTPGSFNTTLGVIRTVREYLKPYNEVFIVEMGAKQPGDIKEICDLVHPTTGIITAVGPQHLESFKTIENVQATKFELADAMPDDGLVILNNDFEYIANRKVENTNALRYKVSSDNTSDYQATNVEYTSHGTTFTVCGPDDWRLDINTRLMGECNVSDLLAAIVCAHSLGVSDSKIKGAVASIEPVEHRLSVKTTAAGITILDDAFNSNPVGSRMALEVLGAMKGGRRIVITPGMIELGDEQFELNRQLGATAARNCDIAIVVGQYNREAIASGIEEANVLDKNSVHLVDSFAEAQRLLSTFVAKGDIILYENDLPDTFK